MPTEAPPATGTFCWRELMTTDVPTAKTFYTQLFDWTTEEMDMGENGIYTMFKNGDTTVAGLMNTQGDAPPQWMCYVTVDDVDASAAKAESLGATIAVPPTDIPNIGRFAVTVDPTGAPIGLFKGAEG